MPVSIAALSGVNGAEAGLASGLINTSQQVGGALGLAILATVSATRTENLLANGTEPLQAVTEGFSLAFWVGAGVIVIALMTVFQFLRRGDLRAEPRIEIAAEAAGSDGSAPELEPALLSDE